MSIDNSGDINTIILAAGKFNPKNISSGMITDPGLLPIRGKPAINWCIDAAKKNGAGDIKIVLRSSNTRLSRFLVTVIPMSGRFSLAEMTMRRRRWFRCWAAATTICRRRLSSAIR